ncbi:sensor histidine kinase N-terminal domain-containing protein [Burkholderia vietnamiensis]|jgi:signal transduction histidine kinase|uniref:histidine kinase n=1 Tax=Burkholderia aenigmatica TaxID=2015348 RepID=A0A6P2QAS6_9BURK|nr:MULTISPECIES: ATP-binding protein [Burkholderia cepacia complex]KVF74792.1 histidine kinase [Burkholderia vietnamiensis]KVF89998.1 histidine kinase [Burkholderia vietnamiensis]KVF90168.1 histidine kinase [Burkholderia vietnamiensis]KVF95357.1 histidine kinase [Burkholderia vietnamiensis]KVS13576.1 histidine kinase [Burkholderia vietnamiensis]
MKSLRRRLLLWLVPATLLIGVIASATTYWGALTEIDELLSDQLKAVARHVNVDANGRLSLTGVRQSDDTSLSGQQSHGVLLEIWRGSGVLFSTDPDSSLPPPRGPGLVDVASRGQLWHTYVYRSGDTLIRVAQVQRARWEAVAEIAMHLLWPVLSLLPVLALFLWFGIGYGLHPLREIASTLRRRDADNMQSIDTATMPGEVVPLADAINDLLRRLDESFSIQRRFIADAAHELRTPIMGLGIQAELLPLVRDEQERDAIVTQIRIGTSRLAHLAEQLLTLARLAPQAPDTLSEPIDIAAIALSVVGDRERVAQAHHVDLGLVAAGAVIVRGNQEELRILLNNLVDNAIRYAGAGASIDVVVEKDGDRPVLEVRDTGPGIPDNELTRVWERFYRGAGQHASGTGLGLSIVQGIAEHHQAELQMTNRDDTRGLSVRVIFPRQAS